MKRNSLLPIHSRRMLETGMLAARALLITMIFAAATTDISAQEIESTWDFDNCKTIVENQARLDCFRALLSKTRPDADAGADNQPKNPWPLVRVPRSGGSPDATATTRTPDTTRSDPDFAGLMIRCREGTGLDMLLALVRPLRPRSKKDVTVTLGKAESVLHGETSPTGTAILLPVDVAAFTTGPWRDLKELAIRIDDSEGEIRGVVPLDGIVPAVARLQASCPRG